MKGSCTEDIEYTICRRIGEYLDLAKRKKIEVGEYLHYEELLEVYCSLTVIKLPLVGQ